MILSIKDGIDWTSFDLFEWKILQSITDKWVEIRTEKKQTGKMKQIQNAQTLIPRCATHFHHNISVIQMDKLTNVLMGMEISLNPFFPHLRPSLKKKWVLYNHWMQKGWHLIVQSIQINNMLCASISCYIPRILNSKLLHRTVFFLFLSLSFDWLIGLFFFRSLFLSMIRKSILHCV